MEKPIIYLALVLFGLCLGSYAGATVWRLRARQLKVDKEVGEEFDKKEFKKLEKLTKASLTSDRSQCLHCSYVLKWYDLIPLVSWLSLGGKCRNCHKPIGKFEPIIEASVAVFFVVSYLLWPNALDTGLQITTFIVWLLAGVCFAILFAYDTKWFLLPDKVNYTLIGFGVVTVILTLASSPSSQIGSILLNELYAALILSGFYLALYLYSKGAWIGFGDIKLGFGLALLLGDWRLAFIALFAANIVGCLIVIPGMVLGKLNRQSRVPFGPLLIIGCVIAQLAGPHIISIFFGSLI